MFGIGVGGIAPGGVQPDLEAGIAAPRHGQPPAHAIVPPGFREAEITVNAPADANTIAKAYTASRSVSLAPPEPFLLYKGDVDPAAVHILNADRDVMAPELQPGDPIVVDTFRRSPTLGELFVLRDGNPIAVKRYARVRYSEPPTIRLHFHGRLHPPYVCIASPLSSFTPCV